MIILFGHPLSLKKVLINFGDCDVETRTVYSAGEWEIKISAYDSQTKLLGTYS